MPDRVTKLKRLRLPYGTVEVPASIIPIAARRVAGLGAASFNLATMQEIAMGAYLQGVEDCYTALDHSRALQSVTKP